MASPVPTATALPSDTEPPRIRLASLPGSVAPADGLKIVASAEDNVAVARMALGLDGRTLYEVPDASLRHNLNTLALAPGRHQIIVEAWDISGNVAREQAAFDLLSPTAHPTLAPTPAASPTPQPTATAMATPSRAPTAPPTAQPITPLAVSWEDMTVNTYAYEGALYTDPAKAGHPYSLLRRDQVGPPRPRTFKTLIVRNEYLELTFLPELGGRLYQCRFLPTNQTLFYNNRTIKPTHWGPPDQGWWLAAGGMEWCLPVNEHGYVTAEPWTPEVSRRDDGGVVVAMSIQERSRNIRARIEVSLRPREAGFRIRTTLQNPDAQAKRLQFWINAMLSPGASSVRPSLRFYYPTSSVTVHSRGDDYLPNANQAMSWPIYAGRDLSHYANWNNWLGFFAPDLRTPFTALYDETPQLGMVRTFPRDVARGSKLFGFGLAFGDTQAYTDDASQYVEMWGGLTPTFGDDTELGPQAQLSWEEAWYVLSRGGSPTSATAEAALNVARAGNDLALTVCSVGERNWTLRAQRGAQEIARQPFTVRPDQPFRLQIALEAGNSTVPIVVSIVDSAGNTVLSHTI